MKLSRIIATGAVAALVGVSTIAIGGAAVAADSYTNDTQFPAETSPYSAGWFTGGGSTGAIDSTPSGLSLTGRYQILNGTTPTTGLGALVDGADFTVISGNANFQIPLFTDGVANTGFTTLRPDNFGPVGLNPLAGWTTSGTFGTFAAGSSHTIPEYVAELTALGDDYEILAFGLIVPVGSSAVISSITWAGNTHWFLPAPTATITPTSITVADVSNTAKGVTGVFTGFVPNEPITIFLSTGNSGGPIDTATADANGTVTYRYVPSAADAAVGTYFLGAIGDNSDVNVSDTFAVIANSAATPDASPAASPAATPDASPAATPAVPVKGNASYTG